MRRHELPDGITWHDEEPPQWTPDSLYEERPYKSEALTHLKQQAARFRWTIEPHRKGWAVQMPKDPRYPEHAFYEVVGTLDDVQALIDQAIYECERPNAGWMETAGKLTPAEEEKPFWRRLLGL